MKANQLFGTGSRGMGVSWVAICLVRRLASQDPLGHRICSSQFHHTHERAVPRFGGIALAVAFLAVALAAFVLLRFEPLQRQSNLTLLLGGLAMFGVGLWDDFRPLGAKKKLLLQLLISTLVYLGGIQ